LTKQTAFGKSNDNVWQYKANTFERKRERTESRSAEEPIKRQ